MINFLNTCKTLAVKLLLNREVMRVLLFSLIISLGLMSDDPVLYTSGIVVVLAWLSHITRKIMFPYLDMHTLVKSALDGKTSSAIVFSSICALIGVLMICATMLLS